MAIADKIKEVKDKLKEAKADEKTLRAGKTAAEKVFKADSDKESARIYIDIVRSWTKSVLDVEKLTDKLDTLIEKSSL